MGSKNDVIEACHGVSKIICVANGPLYKWWNYPVGFMEAYVTYLIEGMRIHGVNRFVFQAGSVQPFPG